MRNSQKVMSIWAIVFVVGFILFQYYEGQRQMTIRGFDYSKFVSALKAGEIESVTIRTSSQEVSGKIKDEFKDKYKGAVRFVVPGNVGDTGFELIREQGIIPNYEAEDGMNFLSILGSFLPMLLVFGIFLFLIRQMQVGGGKAMSFGKSRAKMLTENKKKVTFQDVAGVEEAKQDLEEIVEFLKNPKKFTRLGGRIPKGVLLVGSPGTGKTLLARAVAGEAGVPFFTISGSDFVEMFVGVGASRVRDLFEQGKKNAPCLIFIDEIDAVGRHRGAGMGGGHDEREQTLNQLLVEMDGFEGSEGVILIAATNRPDVLDPALLRPGRFDRRVIVNKPDLSGRKEILKVHTRKTPLASDVDLDKVAKGTPGFSGADLENLVNESALQAARYDKHRVEMVDFESAKDKVLMGAERKSMIINEEERKVTAYHEAGHTLVGYKLPHLDKIHKVTIIPRGMALGVTQTLPEQDQLSLTKSKALNMLPFLFGGRVAEALVFNEITTGASNDIEKATSIARSMVCEWGMSDKLGPIALEKKEGPVFLGMQQSQHKDYSEAKAQEIDTEIHRIIDEGYQKAVEILSKYNKELVALAEALLELETIDNQEIRAIIDEGIDLQELVRRRELSQEKMNKEQKAAAEEAEEKERKEREEAAKKAAEEESDDSLNGQDPVTA
ncbi:MAG: ATP-dependent zinc metalloprotease FtsH [Bdellovibrionales bacterium]|nr:ATP-dependent zinc metalloprotease FtsH [Bdellovibrionales bacterium]